MAKIFKDIFGFLWKAGDSWFNEEPEHIHTRRNVAWVYIAGLVTVPVIYLIIKVI